MIGSVARARALACAFVGGLLGVATHAGAQRAGVIAQGDHLVVSVLTFGQGDQVWERFGHNALRLRDTVRGIDIAYNWGTFSFDQPRFLQRFLTGNTLYWLDTVPGELMIAFYARELNRTVIEQRLALTPSQREKMRAFLAWNIREENRHYRYDYFIDNCSTRLRDALDATLDGGLRRYWTRVPSTYTYRSESLRLTAGLHLTQAGMHVALGAPADRPMTAWDEAFVPMRLRDRLRTVNVAGPDGPQPLVAEERLLYQATRSAETVTSPSLVGRFSVVGVSFAALLFWLGSLTRRGVRGGRVGFAIVGALWGLVVGVLGVVLALAWGITRHLFWYENANLLPLAPVALAFVALLPLASRPRLRRAAMWVAAVLATATVVALLAQAVGLLTQRNLAVLLFALPVHAVLAWTLWRWAASDQSATRG